MESNGYKNYSVDSSIGSDETSDGEIICGRRQRRTVDYKKLYDVSKSKFLKIKIEINCFTGTGQLSLFFCVTFALIQNLHEGHLSISAGQSIYLLGSSKNVILSTSE